MKRFHGILIAGMLVAWSACAPPRQPDTSAEIARAAARWEPALNAGNLVGIVQLYADDARVLPPHAGPLQGIDAVRAAFEPMIAAEQQIALDSIEVVGTGDTGYHVGIYTVTGKDGSTIDRGKYVETWRRIDGSWKMTNDIWNSDLPAIAGADLLLITHEVSDPGRWLAAWRGEASRSRMFTRHGATAVRVFQAPDDPTRVGLAIEVADREALATFLASPEAGQAKTEDGVIGKTLRVLPPAG